AELRLQGNNLFAAGTRRRISRNRSSTRRNHSLVPFDKGLDGKVMDLTPQDRLRNDLVDRNDRLHTRSIHAVKIAATRCRVAIDGIPQFDLELHARSTVGFATDGARMVSRELDSYLHLVNVCVPCVATRVPPHATRLLVRRSDHPSHLSFEVPRIKV